MVKSLGKEAYKAARDQTTQKLNPMKEAFIAVAKENKTSSPRQESNSNSSSTNVCRE